MLEYEATIYGALVYGGAEEGRKFFMNLRLQEMSLYGMGLGRSLVHSCIDGTAEFKFRLEDKRDGLREITGRSFEVHEKEKKIRVFSEENAEVKWCDFTYELRPRGVVAPVASANLRSRIEDFTARWSGRVWERLTQSPRG